MDPVSQAVFGAVIAQAASKKHSLAKAAVVGGLAGMAADLDVFIRSSSDTLLALEFHRQFTHSLAFIPIGALFCALLLHGLLNRRWQLPFKTFYLWSFLGYATHGLLDACTSYGTQLFWPFSNYRVAWDIISIIDPLFTLPLLLMVFWASVKNKPAITKTALIWLAVYLSLASLQHARVMAMAEQLIAERGQQALKLTVKPSFANLLLWKLIYATEDEYFVAAIRPGINQAKVWPGQSIKKLNLTRDLPWLASDTQQAADIQRFAWFSSGFIVLDPNNPYQIIDMRYSMQPDNISPLWGIRLSPKAKSSEHAQFYAEPRKSERGAFTVWAMIVGAENE